MRELPARGRWRFSTIAVIWPFAHRRRAIRCPGDNDRQGIRLKLALLFVSLAALVAFPPRRWNGVGAIRARGLRRRAPSPRPTLPNADGFYAITAIKGEANGVAITGLQPAGTSIPATTAIRSTVSSAPRRRSFRCTASATRSRTGPTPIPSTATISSRRAFTRFFPIQRTARRASRW